MNRILRKNRDQWWYTLGTLIATILSSIALFQAAGISLTISHPFAVWLIFALCVAALQTFYEIIFALVAYIVDVKWRQFERRRQAGRTA